MLAEPREFSEVRLAWTPAIPPPTVVGTDPEARSTLPLTAAGTPYERYSRAVRDLARPTLFENRPGYRLLEVDWSSPEANLTFGYTSYFDSVVDVSSALAHEYGGQMARTSPSGNAVSLDDLPFRSRVGDPFDLARRSVLPSIDTLTIRKGRDGKASFVLHYRDAAAVATASSLYHLMPAGVFQPSSIAPSHQANDFSLWRSSMREFAEEFLGMEEADGSSVTPIDYEGTEPFRSMVRAREAGTFRMWCFGVGLDPLSLCGEILSVAVIDADVYDEIFAGLVATNQEGSLVSVDPDAPTTGLPFTEAEVNRLGNAVARELLGAGFDVVAGVHKTDPWLPEGVEIRRGDLADPESTHDLVRDVDAVAHLVALARVREAASMPRQYYRVNTVGTLNLLDALAAETDRTGTPARLVFSSTAAVYGTPAKQPIDEATPLAPMNPYPASKVAAEDLIGWQAATGALGATTLRLFNAAGAAGGRADPDLTRVIPKVAAVAAGRENELVVNGDGTAIRDFVHVRDIARAVALALQAADPGRHEVYNVGATPASVLDIVRVAESVTGRLVAVRHQQAYGAEAPVLTADTTKIRSDLGWQPENSALERLVGDQYEVTVNQP
ncbi:NAD-dependent epimerase/dehydratase family protein [Actinopolymorpha sp. NPDC004070]|uniref:NAD-dependent epimerase/dehydratase family protein n=1 Tax=Actinopolymorpha sp. NPDC004070 TaxID=3154548 RepID=UPI0033AB0D43